MQVISFISHGDFITKQFSKFSAYISMEFIPKLKNI